ncbi:MAG: hypothetical protein ABGY96_30485 [bacterium]|nr:hypothetical protein [Gammaproteobacteria bacterium]HIL97482.1 hypothetical protein [Pseudomonadales bacterium]
MLDRLLVVVLTTATAVLAVSSEAASVNSTADLTAPDEALIYEINQEYDHAIGGYKADIESTEEHIGPFAEELIDPLMGLARSYKAIGDYDSSIKASERAQHLSHRHDGVYSLRQLEMMDLLTEINLNSRQAEEADKNQLFALFIAEHNYDRDSMEILPALEKMSHWYVETGQFSRAFKTLDRSEQIVTQNRGATDPLQFPSIIMRAKIKRLMRSCCSHKVLEEALVIIQANPNISNEWRSQVYVELADAYSVIRNEAGADNYYRLAWAAMGEKDRQENFAHPQEIALSKPLTDSNRSSNVRIFRIEKDRFGQAQMAQLTPQEQLVFEALPPQEFLLPLNSNDYKVRIKDSRYRDPYDDEKVIRVVGHPFQFVHKQLLNILPLSLQGDDALFRMGIELNFTVGANGDLSDIEVSTAGLPSKLTRLMRQVLRKATFRPRLVNGEPVATSHVTLYQTFEP